MGIRFINYREINDRGFFIDSARHFTSVDQIKHLIDLMAMHKLNTLEWGLSNDEGWRIEIKRYPILTSIGAWRGLHLVIPPSLGDGPHRYGGYYSQAQIRNVVKYAQDRHVEIIPVFEMPGHARAMMVSLPKELHDPTDHSTYTTLQGYHDNILSPCIDSTYKVIDNIFTEVAELFPSKIIHIGVDEIPVGPWLKSTNCTMLKKNFGLKNTVDLQKYFLQQVENIIYSKNKKMAGWEEIIYGHDLVHPPLVFSWSGTKIGIEAAKKKFPVIMMPAQYLYFDMTYNTSPNESGLHWAGYIDTFKTYSYNPLSPQYSPDIIKQIMGVQGALWTELIYSQKRMDYMLFPRLAALSEVAWTPVKRKNWLNFSNRMSEWHLQRLKYCGIKYRSGKFN